MLTHFHIAGFRGMPDTLVDISARTAIIGANGSGKTHILEGLHLAAGGSLHYFHAPRGDEVHFDISYRGDIGPKNYSLDRVDGKDRYAIQGGKVSGVKYREELPFRTVFLSPFDMNLLYFAPSLRRDYIDSILARTFAQFPKVRRDYETVMRQRNALLKKIRDGEANREDLDFWDRSFAEKAYLYSVYRGKFIDFVRETGGPLHAFLPRYAVEFYFDSKVGKTEDIEIFISEYLRENRERDILTGHTHIGPHLDDFGFRILSTRHPELAKDPVGLVPGLLHPPGGPLSSFHSDSPFSLQGQEQPIDATMMLSRGETKMLLLSLKQIEILFLRKHLSLPIVLLFDDLFAELDLGHAVRVIETFDADQVIVTSQRALPKGEKWDDFACIMRELP